VTTEEYERAGLRTNIGENRLGSRSLASGFVRTVGAREAGECGVTSAFLESYSGVLSGALYLFTCLLRSLVDLWGDYWATSAIGTDCFHQEVNVFPDETIADNEETRTNVIAVVLYKGLVEL
jgi:hypothetical protein